MKYLPRAYYTENKKKTSWCSIGRGRIILFRDGQWVEKPNGGYLTTNQFHSIADEDVQLGRTHIK